MSILIDTPAALVASPRPCAPAGARLHADDAQPRLRNRSAMPAALMAWHDLTGFGRGLETATTQTQDGRTAFAGAAYVATTKRHSIRSGPPTSRPPA